MPIVIYRMENTVCLHNNLKSLNVLDKCDTEKVPYILLKKTLKADGKKSVQLPPSGWNKMTYQHLMENYNNKRKGQPAYNTIMINIQAGGFVVADCDKKEQVDYFYSVYGNKWETKSCSKNLPHVWFKRDKNDNNGNKVNVEKGIDILYSFVYERIDMTFNNVGGDIPTFTDFKIQTKETKAKKRKIKMLEKPQEKRVFNINDEISNEEREIIENIDLKYINNYHVWYKLIFSLWNTYQNIDICVWFSRRDPNHIDIDADTIFKKIQSDTQQAYNFGSVCYYSKLSNLERFIEIKSKYRPNFILGTDGGLARYFLEIEADNIISHNGVFYVFTNPYWEQVTDDNSQLFVSVSETLLKCIDVCIKKTKELDEENMLDVVASYKDLRLKVDSTSKLKNIVTFVKSIVKKEDKDYKMNLIQPYYFCFANCAFDLKTKQKVKVTKYDYISVNTGYDYIEPTEKQHVFIDGLIKQILPEDEVRKCALSVFKCGLIGILIEKFVLFNGSGRNGKGLLLAYFKSLMGKYCSDADVSLLTQNKKASAGSANPELASLEFKRCCIMSEPEEDELINTGMMKLLTGNKTFKTRGLYQSAREICNLLITILECNSRPEFKGRKDNALYSRLVDILFTQEFGDDEERIENDENYHKVDPTLKDEMMVSQHATAFFHILLQIEGFEVYEPPTVKDRSKNFLMGTDALVTWIYETFEYVEDKKEHIKMKEVYDMFKESPFYHQLDTKEKRRWNKTKFVENMENNIKLRKYCKENTRFVKIFTNHKLKI